MGQDHARRHACEKWEAASAWASCGQRGRTFLLTPKIQASLWTIPLPVMLVTGFCSSLYMKGSSRLTGTITSLRRLHERVLCLEDCESVRNRSCRNVDSPHPLVHTHSMSDDVSTTQHVCRWQPGMHPRPMVRPSGACMLACNCHGPDDPEAIRLRKLGCQFRCRRPGANLPPATETSSPLETNQHAAMEFTTACSQTFPYQLPSLPAGILPPAWWVPSSDE